MSSLKAIAIYIMGPEDTVTEQRHFATFQLSIKHVVESFQIK